MKEFYNNAYKIDSPHKYGGVKTECLKEQKNSLK